MKFIFLLLGIVSLVSSVYFMLDVADIFNDMIDIGTFKMYKDELIRPFFLFIIGLFYIFDFFRIKKKKKISLSAKLSNSQAV